MVCVYRGKWVIRTMTRVLLSTHRGQTQRRKSDGSEITGLIFKGCCLPYMEETSYNAILSVKPQGLVVTGHGKLINTSITPVMWK